jgi:hypothetical protein
MIGEKYSQKAKVRKNADRNLEVRKVRISVVLQNLQMSALLIA